MSQEVFVIRNQLGQYWTRNGEWVDGREPQRVLKAKHRDEALNQLVELSAKDIELRGEILSAALNNRGEPDIEASEHLTPTLAEQAAERAALTAAANEEQDAAANEEQDAEGEEPPSSATV